MTIAPASAKIGETAEILTVREVRDFRQHATTSRSTILVVDDETAIRELLVSALATKTREVLTAGSGEEALEIVKRSHVDLVLPNLAMPGMNGVDTFREIHCFARPCPC
jgi:CheY-like chemotaxis protein